MAMEPSDIPPPDLPTGEAQTGNITEAEAKLYDRQIRLWGVDAQNRMRKSTILILSLPSLAQETIKNLVLAGVGTIIIMDDKDVSEEDLGGGLLFREGNGDVGKKRVDSALPQINSLNPLVKIIPLPTLAPFIPSTSTSNGNGQAGPSTTPDTPNTMDEFLKTHKVDLVCVCGRGRVELIAINQACRRTSTLFYASSTYGFLGYIFADLGQSFEFRMPAPGTSGPTATMVKKSFTYPPLAEALTKESAEKLWKGKTKVETKNRGVAVALGVMSLWEYQSRHSGSFPTEQSLAELNFIAEGLRLKWGVNPKALPKVPEEILSHIALNAQHEFAPTAAILGGMLAQDVLKALSQKEKPVANFLAVNTMVGEGLVSEWGMGKEVILEE